MFFAHVFLWYSHLWSATYWAFFKNLWSSFKKYTAIYNISYESKDEKTSKYAGQDDCHFHLRANWGAFWLIVWACKGTGSIFKSIIVNTWNAIARISAVGTSNSTISARWCCCIPKVTFWAISTSCCDIVTYLADHTVCLTAYSTVHMAAFAFVSRKTVSWTTCGAPKGIDTGCTAGVARPAGVIN